MYDLTFDVSEIVEFKISWISFSIYMILPQCKS